MSRINLASHPPIANTQENIVFAGNGNVALCYEVKLPEIYSLSEKDFEDLHTTWFQALKSLPVGFVVHKQDVYQKLKYSSADLPNTTFLEQATYHHFKGRDYIKHDCYVFFMLTRNRTLNNSKFVNPFRNISKQISQQLDENVHNFMAAVNDSVLYTQVSHQSSFMQQLDI